MRYFTRYMLCSFLFFACNEKAENPDRTLPEINFSDYQLSVQVSPLKKNDTLLIALGSGSGMCTGYCEKVIYINPNYAESVWKGNGRDAQLLPKSAIYPFDSVAYVTVVKEIATLQLNIIAVRKGCPDCNDGGYEYLEIDRNGEKYHYTFEPGRPPQELHLIYDYLKRALGDITNR
jgi:hypothetical protein